MQTFIFVNFVQRVNFERLQFRKMALAFTEVYLFKFSSLPVLGESSFKAPIVTLEEHVYQ